MPLTPTVFMPVTPVEVSVTHLYARTSVAVLAVRSFFILAVGTMGREVPKRTAGQFSLLRGRVMREPLVRTWPTSRGVRQDSTGLRAYGFASWPSQCGAPGQAGA